MTRKITSNTTENENYLKIRLFDKDGKIKPDTVSLSDFIKISQFIDGLIKKISKKIKQESANVNLVSISRESLGIDLLGEGINNPNIQGIINGIEAGFEKSYHEEVEKINSVLKNTGGSLIIEGSVDKKEYKSRIITSENPIKTIEHALEEVEGYCILGKLIKIGGTNDKDISVEVVLSDTGNKLICKMKNNKILATDLAKHLYQKISFYGTAQLGYNNVVKNFEINEFIVKKPLDPEGLFHGISDKLKNDKTIKKLLEKGDLTEYFKELRN